MSQSSAKQTITILGGTGEVVDDLTPQLGGPLDVNGKKIVSVTNGNIDIEPHGTGNILLGNLTIDADQTVGAGQDNFVLTYDNASGLMVLEVAAAAGDSDTMEYANLIGTPTINTMTEIVMSQGSPGTNSGGAVTDGGSGTADVSAWTGWLRASSTATSTLYSADVSAATGLALTDLSLNFIYVEYNAGTPQIVASTTLRADVFSNVILGVIYRSGTDLHITQGHVATHNFNPTWVKRDVAINGIVRESGIVTSETGNRLLAITVGTAWLGTEEFTVSAIDTSVADTFSAYYDDGAAGWTEVTVQTVIDNGFWDDGTGALEPLGTGKFGVHWVYRGLDNDVYVVYGTTNGNLQQANAAELPTSLPPHMTAYHAIFVAKIIVGLNDTNLTTIQYPWESSFSVSGATAHGDLSGLSADDHPQYAQVAAAETITSPWTYSADIVFTEAADHSETPAAGFGQLWVRSDTPNVLVFTDDAGTDTVLGAGGGGGDVTKVGTPVDNQVGVWTGDGTIEGPTTLTYDGTELLLGAGRINLNWTLPQIRWEETGRPADTGNWMDLVDGSIRYFRLYNDAYTGSSEWMKVTRSGSSVDSTTLYLAAGLEALKLSEPDDAATFGVRIIGSASSTSRATLNIPEGVAPTSPVDGDVWVTAAGGYFARLNGVSVDLSVAPTTATNTQTGTSYTAVITDAEKMITLDNAAAIAMTIPANASVAYPVGTTLNFMQLGAGAVTIGITTDTLDVASVLTLVLAEKFAVATAVKITSTTWVLFGNLAAA
jgi:hypothetical protein